jgi:hypothetical protein
MDNSEKKEEVVNNQPTQTLRITKETLLNNLIPVVLRQTDYTEEQAKNKLEEHNFDLKKVLYEWMGVDIKKEEVHCSTGSQERYRVIRQTMDDAGKKFR